MSPLRLGAAYYPEHWPTARWATDIRQMQEAGCNVMRLAEFAWSTMEPAEGHYEFGWLEEIVEMLGKAGIASVLGTPTAAPPAWLTQAYPEVLAIDEYGRPAQHGRRCHFDVTSPRYIEFCSQIAAEMARCFGQNPYVIGWQLDNEYNRVSYSAQAAAAFQEWLKTQFVDDQGQPSLAALNAAWAAAYWSETYSSWSQIPLPMAGGHNPGLMLKFHQFITGAYVRFQRAQIDAIRPLARPEQWITTNLMGFFDGFDHYKMCEDLDMATWDWYIGTGHADLSLTAAAHDLTRGFKRRNFWVMETQPGSVNWSPVNNMLNRGEARAMAWSAVGHGSDGILYWQWRNALNGQEQYHGSLIGSDGEPRPFYQDAQRLGQDFAAVGDLLDGTTVSAQVAVLHSYDDRWSIDVQRHHKDFDPLMHLANYYRQFSRRNIATDVLSTRARLAGQGYKLVVAAPVHVLDDAIADELLAYVAEGGNLVLGPRSGFKDDDNALIQAKQPGQLAPAAGAQVVEYYALDVPAPVRLTLDGQTYEGQAQTWAEWLQPAEGTEVLGTYGAFNGWLDGQAAVTVHAYGKGRVYYVAAWLDEALQSALCEWIMAQAGVEPVLPGMPAGVQAMRRGDVYIVVNGTRDEQQIALPWPAHDYLAGADRDGAFTLAGYDVAVVTRK
jgi:beta-galactosidase